MVQNKTYIFQFVSCCWFGILASVRHADRESRRLFDSLFAGLSLSEGKSLSKAERRRKGLMNDRALIYGEVSVADGEIWPKSLIFPDLRRFYSCCSNEHEARPWMRGSCLWGVRSEGQNLLNFCTYSAQTTTNSNGAGNKHDDHQLSISSAAVLMIFAGGFFQLRHDTSRSGRRAGVQGGRGFL